MKKIITLCTTGILLYTLVCTAQSIQWQNTIGGSGFDQLRSIQQTADGGYILGGSSRSDISGDKTESNMGTSTTADYWVVKLNSEGNIEWQNTIGGSGDDQLQSIQQTADGGYILGGYSRSDISGDKTENCIIDSTVYYWDYWVVKLNSGGNIEWQNTIGGNGDDYLNSIQQTTDGGYILGGSSTSGISGDKTEGNIGYLYDYWVVKLNSVGNIEWQNTIGGSIEDALYSIQQTADGGYILGGNSRSDISGDKTEGDIGYLYDYWVVKLNSVGNIEWQNTIGGSLEDYLYSIQQTTDGGYILGGTSESDISGDKTENRLGPYNTWDYWVVKLNSVGNIVWQNTIGGSSTDILNSIQQTADGGYILGGYSRSDISGDKTENCIIDSTVYYWDYWVVKLNSVGNIEWQNTIGGSQGDWLNSIQQTADGGYILGGYSASDISGDKTEGNVGESDYWVVKIDGCTVIDMCGVCNGPGPSVWYQDLDGDGLGNFMVSVGSCSQPNGYVSNAADTNDNCVGEVDICGVCNGPGEIIWYEDSDGDGLGNAGNSHSSCVQPIGWVSNAADTDDTCAGEVDICGVCNGPGETIWYEDSDGDGLGNAGVSSSSCTQPIGYVSNATDTDDTCAGEVDICGVCNGSGMSVWYQDLDGDGLGNAGVDSLACIQPLNYVADNTDDDDMTNVGIAINPTTENNDLNVNIFPNPSLGIFTIIPTALNSTLQIQIINTTGKTILTREITTNAPSVINLSNQPKGVYFLKITDGKGHVNTQKLIIN